MPIRFRCAYCEQLMSIATRKAGAVICCTQCARELIVPMPEGQAPTDSAAAPNPGNAFEAANFDVELESNPGQTTHAALPPPPPVEPQPLGIFVSVLMLCIALGFVLLLLIGLFIAGFVLGRMTATPELHSRRRVQEGDLRGSPTFVEHVAQ